MTCGVVGASADSPGTPVDAILAAVAGREAAQGAEAPVFTSGTGGMQQLLAGRSVRVEKV